MTVPLRTKMASPVWQPNIEGNSYLTVTVNEQYDESGQLSAPEKPSAIFGYIGPIHKSVSQSKRDKITSFVLDDTWNCPRGSGLLQ